MWEWERPQVLDMLVAGDLNSNLEQPGGYWRKEEIVAVLTTAVFEDMLSYFLPRRHP